MYIPINTPQGGGVDIASFSAIEKDKSVPGQLSIMVYLGAAIRTRIRLVS